MWFIYLLSPDSVNCDFCQRELDLAVSLNKRIIPLLVRATEQEQVPIVLRSTQYIDLTDNLKEEDYHLDESELLRILHQDEAYYNEHKILLTKALKWQRQHKNPSILLRGYNLHHAEAWLKVAKPRTQHPPTDLHVEFINESLRQPPASSLDVFISYSRADSDFARKLNDALQIQGKTTWFDQESIASGANFQQEINRGIEACDNFLFILSPRSIKSPYCDGEVRHAAQLKKRFLTVLHQALNSTDLHPELAKVQWIDFNHHERDFNANFNQLVRTLDNDREYVHSHTKWLQRAIEWDSKGKSRDLLLRGSEFAIAQNWLQEAEQKKKQPPPTPLQKGFIKASQKAIEKAKILVRGVFGATLLAAIGLGSLLWLYYKTDEIKNLARNSIIRSDSNKKTNAFIAGLRANKYLQNLETFKLPGFNHPSLVSPDTRIQVVAALRYALYSSREINTLEGHRLKVKSINFNPNGNTLASVDADDVIKLWVTFSPDSQILASASGDTNVILWSRNGTLLDMLKGHKDVIYDVQFSPDGQTLASASDDGRVILWNLNFDELVKRSCNLLHSYARSNPDLTSDLRNLCNLEVEPNLLVEQGRDLARKGDKEEAIAKFQETQKQGLQLGFDPKHEANRISEVTKKIDQGKDASIAGNLKDAESAFKEAIELEPTLQNFDIDPEREAKRLYALALLSKVQQSIYERNIQQAIDYYEQVKPLYPEIQISAKILESLCRSGGNRQYADKVLKYCEDAVNLAYPRNGKVRDSQAVARLLQKNLNIKGAIEDFQAFINWTKTEEALESYNTNKPEQWKQKLKAWREKREECIKFLRSEQKAQKAKIPSGAGKSIVDVQIPATCESIELK
jgi:hypothetical protein